MNNRPPNDPTSPQETPRRSIEAGARFLARQLSQGGDVGELLDQVPVEHRKAVRNILLQVLKPDAMERLAHDPYIEQATRARATRCGRTDRGVLWGAQDWLPDTYKQAPGRSWVVPVWWEALNRCVEPLSMRQTTEGPMVRRRPELMFSATRYAQQMNLARNQSWVRPAGDMSADRIWVEQRPDNEADSPPGSSSAGEQIWAFPGLQEPHADALYLLMQQRNKVWARVAAYLLDAWWRTDISAGTDRLILLDAPGSAVSAVLAGKRMRWVPGADEQHWIKEKLDSITSGTEDKRGPSDISPFEAIQADSCITLDILDVEQNGPRRGRSKKVSDSEQSGPGTPESVYVRMSQEDYARTLRWSGLSTLARAALWHPKGEGITQCMDFLSRHQTMINQDLGADGYVRVRQFFWRRWIHQLVVGAVSGERRAPPIQVLDALRRACPSAEDYNWSAQHASGHLSKAYNDGHGHGSEQVPLQDWVIGWTHRRGPGGEKRETGAEAPPTATSKPTPWSDRQAANLKPLADVLMAKAVLPNVWDLPDDAPQRAWVAQKGWTKPTALQAAATTWTTRLWGSQVISSAGAYTYVWAAALDGVKRGEPGWHAYLDEMIQAEERGIINLRSAMPELANKWNALRAEYDRDTLGRIGGEQDMKPNSRKRLV